MRRRAKVDANQAEIVRALRQVGASVQSLAEIGNGCPDILAAYRGQHYLMEVKDGMQSPSKKRLTDDERAWHAAWMGKVYVVESVGDALKVIGL